MFHCSICEKDIYGSSAAPGSVCGSCALTKSDTDKPGKQADTIMRGMFESSFKTTIQKREEPKMDKLKVKCKFARDKVVLIDTLAISFDKDGFGFISADKRSLLDREMVVRPGRYAYVEAPKPVAQPAPPEPEVEFSVETGDEPEGFEGQVEFEIEVGEEPKRDKKKAKKG